jgi:hypothetical protein
MHDTLTRYLRLMPFVLSAAIVGALVFAWVPVLTGRNDIAAIIGRKIVEAGAYPQNAASVIGWTLHIVISIAYAKLYAVIVSLPGFPRQAGSKTAPRIMAGLIVAIVVAVLATWIAGPAISATVSLAAGQGWPATLPAASLKLGLPLWNHLGFFAIVWLIVVVLPTWLPSGRSLDQ